MEKGGVNEGDLQAVSKKFLLELKTLQESNKWQHVDDSPVKVSKIERDGRIVSKGQTTINLPIEVLANFFDDPTLMKKLSDRILKLDILYKGSGFHVIRVVMKGFAMVSDRELVAVFTSHKEGNKFYFGNRSCEFNVVPEKDTVRGFAHVGGYIFQKIDEKRTKVTHIADIDMNGSIPDFIKNKMASTRVTILSELQEKIRATLK